MYVYVFWIFVKCVKDVFSFLSVKCVFSFLFRFFIVKLSVMIVFDCYMEKFFMLYIICFCLVYDWFCEMMIVLFVFSKFDSLCL